MESFPIYLFKSAVCLLLFYVFFKAFLSRETFFSLNRFILLGGMAGCLLFPLLQLEVSGKTKVIYNRIAELGELIQKENSPKEKLIFPPLQAFENYSVAKTETRLVPEEQSEKMIPLADKINRLSVYSVCMVIYGSGGMLVLLWLAVAFLRMRQLIHRGRKVPTHIDRKKDLPI